MGLDKKCALYIQLKETILLLLERSSEWLLSDPTNKAEKAPTLLYQ